MGIFDIFKKQAKREDIYTPINPSVNQRVSAGLGSRLTLDEIFSGWSYICIDRIATEVNKAKFQYGKLINGVFEQYPSDFWINSLFEKPNPFTNKYDTMYLADQWLSATGDAFIWTPLDASGIPIQLWVLPSNKMYIIVEDNKIIRYEFDNNGQKVVIPARQIIHVKTLQPSNIIAKNYIEGTAGSINASAGAIKVERKSLEYTYGTYMREGVAPWVIEMDGDITPHEWATFKENYRKTVGDSYKAVAVLTNGAKAKQLTSTSNTNSDLLLSTENNRTLQQIVSAFKVPLELLTMDSIGKMSLVDIQRLQHYFRKTAIEPRLFNYESEFERHFRYYGEKDLVITHPEETFTDPEEIRKQQAHDIAYGILKPSEIRAKKGLDYSKEQDQYFMVSNIAPLKEIERQEVKSIYTYTKDIEDDAAETWKTYDDIAEVGLKALSIDIVGTYADIQKSLLKSVFKLDINNILSNEFRMLDIEEWKEQIKKDCTGSAINLTYEVGRQALLDIDKDPNEILKGEDDNVDALIGLAIASGLVVVAESIPTIEADLRQSAWAIVIDNQNASKEELVKKIADMINDKFDNKFKESATGETSRADTVAQTSTTFFVGATQTKIWKNYNKKIKWLTQRDGKVRAAHKKADGQIANKKGFFFVGGELMRHPGDGKILKNICNCRCYTMVIK